MAHNQKRRIRPNVIQSDHAALVAVQHLSDYKPFNQNYSKDALLAEHKAMEAARAAEIQAYNALNAARDAVVASA